MITANAQIAIKNLRLRTFIGFNPEERQKQQDVVVNIDLHYPLPRDVQHDKVEAAVDYKAITKQVIQHVEQGSFLLLEKLAADLLAIVVDRPQVVYARVRVDKPHALRFADSVAVTLEHTALNSPL